MSTAPERVAVLAGAGSVGQAIVRRTGFGRKVVAADLRLESPRQTQASSKAQAFPARPSARILAPARPWSSVSCAARSLAPWTA